MTHYDTLGIGKETTPDEIKSVYRRLAFQYHPDRNPGDSASEAKFKQVHEAYETLSDVGKKVAYDQRMPQQPKPKPKNPANKVVEHGDLIFAPPQPPKYDLWGNLLTRESQMEWIRNNQVDPLAQPYVDLRKPTPKKSEDSWYDAFASQYETDGSPDLR